MPGGRQLAADKRVEGRRAVPITYEQIKDLSGQLYDWALRKVPDDTVEALRLAQARETKPVAAQTLQVQLRSAQMASDEKRYVCSDSGVPTFDVSVGTNVSLNGNIKRAFADGFDELIARIKPPLLQHVTNPLTNARGYRGKDMPLLTWDILDGADYIEIVCQPKALGSGRWGELKIFGSPTIEEIEEFILDVIIRAGSQHCPPVMIGVGIGGDMDTAAKMAKRSTLRKIGSVNSEPALAAMEERLLQAANQTGFGPMGTGGDTTALAVHIDYSAGHGFTPVAVSFNCWINRRSRARIYDDGRIERME